ncbi:pentapeptide repeat-containing protein [Nostoc sp. CENA67]|uniref:Pentapeptide repeat-containing protein n=1 Tax=Amazonocrinis nigriterrae CENA67 TaxID=2794033 RepID=A0A8J7LC83_9NOST|nr:pentapeptide repeat-containing protein [Amazonocrinis nigriterrae]MBH8564441.1 pentapeptide repeat-containing protein [Amazonocrinis nigriterrae CENA67]
MIDPSLGRKKRKITIIASSTGVEIAEKALVRLGFDSISNFAKSQLLARTTVTKFFNCEPIQLDSFKKICKELKLNWREIAGIPEKEQSEQLQINDCNSSETNKEVEPVQTLRRQVTVIDEQSQTIIVAIVLEGDINSVPNHKVLESILREYSGKTIKIIDVKKGSIKLFVEGSQEDIERLIFLIDSGELTTISGFPVQNIQVLSESLEDDESNKLDDKWRLVKEIVSQPVKGRKLSSADLSNADLSNADLSGADLSDADLSDADLSDANLSDADLSDANLRGADLRGADLRDADLRGAYISEGTQIDSKWRLVWQIDLSDADLSGADLSGADLSGADLSGADLSGADLSGADLSGADLRDADLRGANLRGADLRGADLSDADLSGADLSGAILIDANLNRTYLIYTNLRGADLRGADLRGADLRGADLRGADLSDAKLSNAKLSSAKLSSAKLRYANLIDANLIDVNLSDADLSNANLSDADLIDADLSNANLSNATLIDADLSNATLIDADLSNANLSRAIVANALFGGSIGLTKDMRRDLESRGAIFGDRPPVPVS